MDKETIHPEGMVDADGDGASPAPDDYSALRRLATNPEYRLVVSFGGGAIAGVCGNIALASLLEELELRQQIAEIWGTSAGAIVGGCWASGTDAATMREILLSAPAGESVDVCYRSLIASLVFRPLGRPLPDGLVRGKRFERTIDTGLRVKDFESCPTPFRCIACSDDGQHRRKVFRKGSLLPAIRASMSLPGILEPAPPLDGDDCGFYDGALVEKTPLISPIAEHLRAGDDRKLLLLATHFSGQERGIPARGFIHRFVQSIHAMEEALWEYQLKEARRHSSDMVNVVLLNPHIEEPGLFDLRHAPEHYRHARRDFMGKLRDGCFALTFGVD
jgi:predicted acylesterase/phospholipase RssA